MAFKIDTRGIPATGGFEPIPPGKYILQIISTQEGYAKSNGKPQVLVGFQVAEGQYRGRKILFHRVTFLGKDENGIPLKGAGIAIHFLHSIGEPYDDENTEVNPNRWIGKTVMATVECKEDFNGKLRNIVKFVDPVHELKTQNQPSATIEGPEQPKVGYIDDAAIPF